MESLQLIFGRIKYEHGTTGGWLIHCKNGHDRTGLVVGMLRIVVDGWDKHHAWVEMLDRGYHPELIGLDRAFHDFANPSSGSRPSGSIPSTVPTINTTKTQKDASP